MKLHASIPVRERRDPALAGGMSAVLPGAGQIYEGEPRKGMLFLAAGLVNYFVLVLLLFSNPVIDLLRAFGTANNVRINSALVRALQQFHFGSVASFVLLALFLGFAAFAARDAYDKALLLKRKPLYPDKFVEMPEAASGSYLMHISFLLSCFVLAFFFLVPPAPREQSTIIEFRTSEENTRETQKSRKYAEHNSKAGGKHDPTRPSSQQASSALSHASSSQSSSQLSKRSSNQNSNQRTSQSQSQPSPKAKQTEKVAPNKVPDTARSAQVDAKSAAAAKSQSESSLPSSPAPGAKLPFPQPPRPALPVPVPARTIPLPTPARAAVANPSSAPAPTAPTPSRITMANPGPQPSVQAPLLVAQSVNMPMLPAVMPKVGSGAPVPLPRAAVGTPSAPPGPGLAPVKTDIAGGSTGSAPVPLAIGSRRGVNGASSGVNGAGGGATGTSTGANGSNSTANSTGAPAPIRASNGGSSLGNSPGTGRGLSLGPVLAPASGRPAREGERQSNADGGPGPDAEHTAQAIDWGSYMADLQRRIRRQWFPPHNGHSNKVRAVFTVHQDGHISSLRLLVSSGLSVSDQAALKAIETAAPLRPLPRGAGESVDIEFTFDYNVFGSGGKAEFKNY